MNIEQEIKSFNSIKVRLKVNAHGVVYYNRVKFQFHKGAIKRILHVKPLDFFTPFQFHKGAIKRWRICKSNRTSKRSFNSIKVRLKARALKAMSFSIEGFNSIKVRLKVRNEECIQTHAAEFQFHKGAIKRNTSWRTWPFPRRVSIP